jgi:hypothetical protein
VRRVLIWLIATQPITGSVSVHLDVQLEAPAPVEVQKEQWLRCKPSILTNEDRKAITGNRVPTCAIPAPESAIGQETRLTPRTVESNTSIYI